MRCGATAGLQCSLGMSLNRAGAMGAISSLHPIGIMGVSKINSFVQAITLSKHISQTALALEWMQLQHRGNSRGSCKLAALRMGKQCPNSSTESVVMLEKSALMFLHLSDFCLSWMFNWKAFICSGCVLLAEFSFSYLVTDWFSVPMFLTFRCFLTLGLCWLSYIRTVLSEWQKGTSSL